jgi:hypothetical protein
MMIALSVLGYFLMGIVTLWIAFRSIADLPTEMAPFCFALWPVAWTLGIFHILCDAFPCWMAERFRK